MRHNLFRPVLEVLEERALLTPAVSILSPLPQSVVNTVVGKTTLVGHVNVKKGSPVVLILPTESPEFGFFVQPIVGVVNGTFHNPIYLGDANTPPGTVFTVVVLLAPSLTAALRSFIPGQQLPALPGQPLPPLPGNLLVQGKPAAEFIVVRG
jgi:hypothetical protein